MQDREVQSLVRKILWRRKWQPTPIFLLGKSHGQRSLAGYTVHRVTKNQTWLSSWAQTHTLLKIDLNIWLALANGMLPSTMMMPWKTFSGSVSFALDISLTFFSERICLGASTRVRNVQGSEPSWSRVQVNFNQPTGQQARTIHAFCCESVTFLDCSTQSTTVC